MKNFVTNSIGSNNNGIDDEMNLKVLVIDDESAVIDTYIEFLVNSADGEEDLELQELSDLSGLAPTTTSDSIIHNFETSTATQGLEAVELVRQELSLGRKFAVAIIDVRMPPGIDGVETARLIRELDDDIHIIFITAYSDHSIDEMQLTLQKNALLLSKPFVGDELVQLVRTLVISWNREQKRMDAEERAQLMATEMEYQANHDALTGLANRRYFFNAMDRLLQKLPGSGDSHALLYLDLDQFKVVNDTCGHHAGDKLLQELTSFILTVIEDGDLLARLGGDEFGIISKDRDSEQTTIFAELILRTINAYMFKFDDYEFTVAASIGIVEINERGEHSRDDILRYADLACYEAKDRGRNQLFFHSDDESLIEDRSSEMEIVGMVNSAIQEKRFVLYAQPIVPLNDSVNQSKHYEVLIRMLDSSGNIVRPDLFIPASERFGLMRQIDRWVISNTFAALQQWCREQKARGGSLKLSLGINLSGSSVMEEDLYDYIYEEMKRFKVDPDNIYFEITETAAIRQLNKAQHFIKSMQNLGFKFALDDFGSGMASFSYLRSLPVDYLKIDGQFVVGMVENKIDQAMVKSMQEISSVMGMESIAEFVESEQIVKVLQNMEVTYAQGYYYDQPKPLNEVLKLGSVSN